MSSFSGTDRFEVRGHLGSGAFGDVYRVYDRRLETIVALKTLQRADPASLYRFKREFRALAELTHPNLVHLYELQATDGRWFFTMELVEGYDFLAFVRQAPSVGPEDETLTLDARAGHLDRLRDALRQLATGLHALQAAGKLHCDIKPSNIRVSREGRVVLLDFGLVRELSADQSFQTRIGEISGTPAYMSPEQAAAERVTAASDWYAVGVVLFEALTGRRPFTGGVLEMLAAKQEHDAPAPRSLRPDLPEDLSRLCLHLLARKAEERPDGDEVLARLGDVPAPGRRAPALEPTPRFVGRKEPLAKLRQAFALTRQGQAVAVFVRGASGIGKTALVRHFADAARRSHPATVVLAGRCYEQESVPYKGLDALIDVLSRYLKQLADAEAEDLLPPDVAALAHLFPVLRRVPAVARAWQAEASDLSRDEQGRRTRAALRALLGRLARRHPLLLVIDDLQWGDRDSAELLAAAMDPPEPPPLLLICCHRDGDRRPPLLERLAASPLPFGRTEIRELTVVELSLPEARELALALLDAPAEDLAREIAQESGGSPFFVAELVRAAQAGLGAGEMSLERLIAERVAALPPASRRLLEIVAVAGQPITLAAAVKASALEVEPHAVVRELRVARLLSAHGTRDHRLETYHDRIREVVVQGLDGQRLRLCHGRLARALEAAGDADPEILARCYQEMGKRERAGELAAAAAERAVDVLAFDHAARLYRIAADLADDEAARHELQVKLGQALFGAGDYAQASQAYLAAAARAEGAERAHLRLGVVWLQFMSGDLESGRKTLENLLAAVGVRSPRSRFQALLFSYFLRALVRIRGLRYGEREAAQAPPELLLRWLVCTSACGLVSTFDPFVGYYFAWRELLISLEVGDPAIIAPDIALMGTWSTAGGHRTRARTSRLIQRALALAKRVDNPQTSGSTTFFAGAAAFFEGRLREARELFDRAEPMLLGRRTQVRSDLLAGPFVPGLFRFWAGLVKIYQLWTRLYQGRLREVRLRLSELLHEAKGHAYFDSWLRSRFTWVLLIAADQPEAAAREIAEAGERWPQAWFYTPRYHQFSARVEIALYRDDPVGAWQAFDTTWRSFHGSQFWRVETLDLRGRAALTAAIALGSRENAGRKLLRQARKDLRALAAERYPWAPPAARLIRAGVATLRHDSGQALDNLAAAEAGFESADRELHAAVCRLRRGQLLGADGQALVEEATRWMEGQGIVNVERMAGVVAPGVWQPT